MKKMDDELKEKVSPYSSEGLAFDISNIMKSLMAMEKCSPHEVESDEQERLRSLYEGFEFRDDANQGELLDHGLVQEARRVEIDFFRKMRVYDKVHKSYARGKKLITCKWADTNKGDAYRPDYRSRLVG